MRKAIDNSGLSNSKKAELLVDDKHSYRRKGAFCSPKIEPLPNFVKAGCEKEIKGQNNQYIIMGRDRPRKRSSGYGGKGDNQCGMIDVVVGRMAYDVADGVDVDNNFVKDAARIYISQKTDIDDNFNILQGKNKNGGILGVPNSNAKSAIGIKADAVRLIAREGIKLVTRIDNRNSAGDDISMDIYGIDLIAGNNPDLLQPIPKGENLVEALSKLRTHLEKLNGIVYGWMMVQNKFNKALANHWHPSPFKGAPTRASIEVELVGKQVSTDISQVHIPAMKLNRTNLKNYHKNYLKKGGDGYINSAYNKVN